MKDQTPRRHIWTETPLTEIWHQLRYLTSHLNVYALLTGSIKSGRTTAWPGSDSTEQQAYAIASCIRQADEYFSASERVSLVTKPLLQFYGVQSLSKALILADAPTTALDKFEYHGLSTRPSMARQSERPQLELYDSNPAQWQIEQEFAIRHGGVFPDLARVAGDSVPATGSVFRFKELLAVIPDLSELFRRHYSEPSHCLRLYEEPKPNADGHFEVVFREGQDVNDVLRVFPEFNNGFEQTQRGDCLVFTSSNTPGSVPAFGVVQTGTLVGLYYVRPHGTGIHTPLSILYAAMFILSIVVRYKPKFWMGVVDGRATGSVSVVEALCHNVRRRFPNDVLQGLWREKFTYGTAAYYS